MNLGIDELQAGIRPNITQTGGAQTSGLSSFAVSRGVGAGAGRVQDLISVDLRSSSFGTNAYADRKRSADQLREAAAQTQDMLAVEHNRMALLSNTLSGEDYQKAQEEGFRPGSVELEDSVTILDRIKTAVLKSGREVAGFTDEIDPEVLKEITGSEAMANALAKSFSENDLPADENITREAADAVRQALSLSAPDDAAVKYMVENGLNPSIAGFYLAESATNGGNQSQSGFYAEENGYLTRKADQVDLDKLQPQIRAVVERAGYAGETAADPAEVLEGAGSASAADAEAKACWLILNDVPLTEEHLRTAVEVGRVAFPVDMQKAADAAAAALSDGRPAVTGNLADPVSLDRRAEELLKRQELEEVRLRMSVEVNRRLLEKGVQIDTLPMEKLIGELETARQELAAELFPEEAAGRPGAPASQTAGMTAGQKYDLFEATLTQVQGIRVAPAAIVGAERETIARGTLSEIAEKGESLRVSLTGAADASQDKNHDAGTDARRFASALNTYEAVGTEVRADLGDSIKKAFRNVEDILKELGLEGSADNARAVRILGYNRMEITEASVEEIREQDRKLRDVTERLKPAAVLSLIRDGKNPLAMTLDELKQELDERGGDAEGSAEKFAKFLYKLEKNDGISEEERQSYIGIYRMFRTLEKTDHAAIGAVLTQGAEMTIGNLLSATRSTKAAARGIDARVDDSFGGVEGGYRTPSISEQIGSAFDSRITAGTAAQEQDPLFRYYRDQAHSAYEHMDADRLAAAAPTEETLLTELTEALEGMPEGQQRSGDNGRADAAGEKEDRTSVTERAYAAEQAKRLRDALSGERAEAAAKELKQIELPVTPDLIEAMRGLQAGRRRTDSVWDSLAEVAARVRAGRANEAAGRGESSSDAQALAEAMDSIEEALSEGTRMEETYRDKTQEMIEDLDRMMEDAQTAIDVQTMLLLHRQLTVATHSAQRGSYDIPVEVDGERVNLHVTLEEGAGEGSSVTASIPTAMHGVLTLSLAQRDGQLTGMLNTSLAEDPRENAYLHDLRDRFAQAASAVTGKEENPGRISLIYQAAEGTAMTAAPGEAMENGDLFRLAKVFVETIR
ncbi:MAG: hypothetical protein II800_03215 [Lachnospiraceae bacterium]|nr:hypothetical protein [Lachnospiraceae bacterium]